MSLMKTEVSCNKFQANMFDQSRCQNCFRSHELHAMTREDMEQVKPIYASWLCLAPEGLDFDNPMQRSRKWQRRFFILYEHGCLEFALDELPSTVPQGMVNMHQCTDVIDAEDRTGQKNTLCIITPDQEVYIRGDSKEIINGWCEQLLVFKQTNEQRRKKKGSRMPAPSQDEASTMKSVRGTGANTGAVEDNELCNPSKEDDPSEESEDMYMGQDVNVTTADADSLSSCKFSKQGMRKLKTQDTEQEAFIVDEHQTEDELILQLAYQHHSTSLNSPEPWRAMTRDLSPSDLPLNTFASQCLHRREDDAERRVNKHHKALSLAKHVTRDQENTEEAGSQQDENDKHSSFIKCRMTGDECWTRENERMKECNMCLQCSSRSQTGCIQNMDKSVGLLEAPQSNIPPLRRLQSVEVKASESTMTPDLLNFSKGWLFMDDHDQWRKYWFLLSAHSLRYYIDSGAKEASQLVGEIDLTTCHRVTELHDQKNFGFEIRTHKMVYKLATTTAGMRQNWIQALTKNIQDQNAPDVASIPDNCPSRVSHGSGPDVTQQSMSLSCLVSDQHCTKQKTDHCRRNQGHPKTSSWTEMSTQEGSRQQERVAQNVEDSISRRRGREERRQRYTIMMESSVRRINERDSSPQDNQQQERMRMRQIEECWLQVEKTTIREEKRVPLYPLCQGSVKIEKLLEHYGIRTEEQSADHDCSQDHGHNTDWNWEEPSCDLQTEWEPQMNLRSPSLTDKYQENKWVVHLKALRRQQINDLLDLYPLSQSSSEFTNEPKRKSECNLLQSEEITSDKPIKSLQSLALCQASRDLGDDLHAARMFSQKSALMMSDQADSDQAMVKLLSQEAEFLTRQNEALNQRNQELENQLAEADREIDRLKSMLICQPNGHPSELESIVECLEWELRRSCGQLQEAQTQLAEMDDNLKDTYQALQLKEATLRGLGFLTMDDGYKVTFPEIIDRLRQCVQVLESKVFELGNQHWLSTLSYKELQTENILLMKSEVQSGQKTMEGNKKNKMLDRELESNLPLCEGLAPIKDQQHQSRLERIEVELKKRSNVLSLLLEVISQLAGNEMPKSVLEHETAQMNHKVLRRLQLEHDIWESFVSTLKNTTSYNMENEEAACVLQSAEMKLEEVKMYHSALSIYKNTSSNPLPLSRNSGPNDSGNTSPTNPDIICLNDGKMEEEQKDVMWKGLKEHMEKRLMLIGHVTSKLESFTNNGNLSEMAQQSHVRKKANAFYPMISVVMDIMADYLVEKLSQSVIITKSVAIQTENQEIMPEQNNMDVNENTEVSEDFGKEAVTNLKSQIKELEHLLSERLTSLQEQHVKDKERFKASFEQGITLLKEYHRKATEVLLLKQQRQQELLQEEKERLLTEEVAACLTVIEAMKTAHSSELEKMLQKAYQEKTYSGGTNIEIILKNHSKELSALQRDLDALSEQYTQKCLENVHLAEALQAERNALLQYECQNLALSAHNQELTSHLVKDIMRLSGVAKDGCSQLIYDGERYELMIKLLVKESCQEQEIDTLKNDLYAAKMGRKFASERLQEIQTELNLVKKSAEQQILQLKENLSLVYEALEESIKRTTPTTPLAASSQPTLCKH